MLHDKQRQVRFVSNRKALSNERRSLGTRYEQRFFAIRYAANKGLSIPFPPGPFNGLISIHGSVDDAVLESVGMQLLEYGMRAAMMQGDKAGRMGEILDQLVDEHQIMHDGRTVYNSVHEDESLEEVIDYFILPNGLAEQGLLVVIGGETDFDEATDLFRNILSDDAALVAVEADTEVELS